MKTITTITSRFARLALATMGLVLLCNTASLAEGWPGGKPPISPACSCDSTDVIYADGSVLYSNGTYVNSNGTYQVGAATYDGSGNLHYPDGTILYTDGSWTPGGNA